MDAVEVIEEEGPLHGQGRDHNQPPALLELEPAVADLREFLTERLQRGDKTFGQRRDEILRSARSAVVRSRETAGAAADVVKIAKQVREEIEHERVSRTRPYREVADALKRHVDEFWGDVDEEATNLRDKIDRWTRDEDARIKAQQDEQREMERKMRAASAPPEPAVPTPPAARPAPAKRRPIRGDYGAQVSQGERKVYEIVDVRALPDWILASDTVRDAILTVVRQTAKHMGDIPGVKVSTEQHNQIR